MPRFSPRSSLTMIALVAMGIVLASFRLGVAQSGGWTDLEGQRVIYSLSFSPNGKQLASQDESGQVRVWDVATGESTVWDEARGPVHFLADGKTLVTGHREGARAWSVAAREALTTVPGTLEAASPTGIIVVADPTVDAYGFRVWDMTTGKELLAFIREEGRYWLAIAPHGKTVALWNEKSLRLFDVVSGKERDGIASFPDNLSRLANGVAFSPDSARLLCWEAQGASWIEDTT